MLLARVFSALLLATLGLPGESAAEPLVRELRLGALIHDVPGLWSGFRLEHGFDLNAEAILSPSIAMFGGHWRPAIGASVNLDSGGGHSRGTSKLYVDARWMYEWQSGLFLGLGIGAAIHDGQLGPDLPDRKALGSRVLFHFPLEVGWRFDPHQSVSIYFDHVSNGYTQKYNEGLDTLGVRYGYRF